MSIESQISARKFSLLQSLILVGIVSALTLSLIDYSYNFAKLWDFQVYLKARDSFLETGNPYYDAESLRFIYPPSASFIFYLINDSLFFRSIVFSVNGALWIMTACLFCRSRLDIVVVVPALLLLFGMQGWVAILTGNIACLLYFIAAATGLLYHNKIISTFGFAAVILLLTLIKPFYAEFLILIWLAQGIRSFLISSFAVVGAFFVINLFFYPELFVHFLNALKVNDYDTEIYGITLLSHLMSFGFSSLSSIILHLLLIGFLFVLFTVRLPSFTHSQQFSCIFILAVFINPKHISYDLMVAVPALVILLLQARLIVVLTGAAILLSTSLFDFNLHKEIYFQWWYGFVTTFILVLIDGRFQFEGFLQRIIYPLKKPR